jgi:predicted aldo/keto reductase-like oxidoreductase
MPHGPDDRDTETRLEIGPAGNKGRSRRQFLKRSASLGGAIASGALLASISNASPVATMRYRTLGRTGLEVSEIGFGAYPVDDPDLVLYALDRGINYIDTSHCYRGGRSEETIGKAIQGRRDRFVLATKWCPHHIGRPAKKRFFLEMLDDSLRRLGTDHVDIVLNHEVGKVSDGHGLERLKNPELFEAWEAARAAGKARFMGVSGHDPDLMEIMHHAVDSKAFDVLLCRYSFLDFPDQARLIDAAHRGHVGFVAMKTLAGAKGADLDRFRGRTTTIKQAALKWVLANEKVSNLVISINSRRQIDEYVGASGSPITSAERRILEEYAETFSTQVCRLDGACLPACPADVRIADILRFSMYFHEYRQERRAIESYARLASSERAAHCLHCSGFCEEACHYDLPIRSLLLKADRALRGGAEGRDRPWNATGPAGGG